MDTFEAFKTAQKQGWAHFAPLEMVTMMPAAQLVKFSGVKPSLQVLDVACGTGVVSVTAARMGAKVTALDLTPELLERARSNSQIAGVAVDWREGDVEKLPFNDASFDVVLSQFGHIFAPRPALALSEMLRVLKPGGTIAFSTWPPDLLVGRMFRLTASYMPPLPPGISSPVEWGDQNIIRQRLGAAVKDISFERGSVRAPALSVQHYRSLTEKTAGPMIRLVENLSANDPAKLEAFRREYDTLAAEYFRENFMQQEYLMTRATKL
ncbi:MAG TPA: methyltransferase domain-containing protein [Candidatus Acidoferrales bacterium]|nr:methyltransferase domain-containing protein [Candidatus Acidoferrales bacterium]